MSKALLTARLLVDGVPVTLTLSDYVLPDDIVTAEAKVQAYQIQIATTDTSRRVDRRVREQLVGLSNQLR